jgi:nucleotide-binding universal stress UspA family protein
MKRILVPVDFSPYAENAFLSAVEIASLGNSTVTCINVVNSELDWKKLPEKEKVKYREIVDLETEAREKLEEFILDHNIRSIVVEAVVEVGTPYEVIAHVAHQHQADLIVIGAYGKGYEEGRFIGSNLQKVIRLAACPVLAVKHAVQRAELGEMVYASLFNQESKLAFLRMKPFILLANARINFLYVNTPELHKKGNVSQEQMDNYAQEQDELLIHKHVHEHSEVEKGIIDFCITNHIGWIGIASNSRKSSSSYRIGVTETLIFKSDFPILSVKFD